MIRKNRCLHLLQKAVYLNLKSGGAENLEHAAASTLEQQRYELSGYIVKAMSSESSTDGCGLKPTNSQEKAVFTWVEKAAIWRTVTSACTMLFAAISAMAEAIMVDLTMLKGSTCVPSTCKNREPELKPLTLSKSPELFHEKEVLETQLEPNTHFKDVPILQSKAHSRTTGFFDTVQKTGSIVGNWQQRIQARARIVPAR